MKNGEPRRRKSAFFLQLLVPFVRKRLIEGVYVRHNVSSVGNVPPGEALQEMMKKMREGLGK